MNKPDRCDGCPNDGTCENRNSFYMHIETRGKKITPEDYEQMRRTIQEVCRKMRDYAAQR
jgi:hypothetical protein